MPFLNTLKKGGKKVSSWLAPPPKQASDGRDQWSSRTSFILAAAGGCAGQGNLLRYPSQVFNNNGLQWFIPYFMTIFLIAIPILMLEVAIGQAYRGGSVLAYNNMNHRLKGTGLGLIFVSFVVNSYFVVILAYIMTYFRHSFTSPLPWEEDPGSFFTENVVRNPDPIPAEYDGANVVSFVEYPYVGVIGETVGWVAFTWFLCWLCIFRGVGMTGQVVYVTMGLPVIVTIILLGRAASLPNAIDGIRMFVGQFNGDQLAGRQIWQTACAQVFFSTGVGFGYFTSYASYNQKHANAVADAIIICSTNALFENVAAFAIFGIIGFLGMQPGPDNQIGAFDVGFYTLPVAVSEMPGANFWAVLVFFTLMVLGFSSAFAVLDAIVTLVMDSGIKWPRWAVVTSLALLLFLIGIPYCTEFGDHLLNGIDAWMNNIALVFVVMSECLSSTTIYRWKDVVSQVGMPAWLVFNIGYILAMILGVAIGHTTHPGIGGGVGIGLFIAVTVVSVLIARTPDSPAPSKWNTNVYTARLWYICNYSGNQLRRDLNVIVGAGKNWKIPRFWPILVRFISAPILMIILSFAYPSFWDVRGDPLNILGFIVGHCCIIAVIGGLIVPRWYNIFIPPIRQADGKEPTVTNVTKMVIEGDTVEEGSSTDEANEKKYDENDSVGADQVDEDGRKRSGVVVDGNGVYDGTARAASKSSDSAVIR